MHKIPFRSLAYALAVMTLTTLLIAIARYSAAGLDFDRLPEGLSARTSEFSAVEIMQNILLLICICVFGWIAYRDRLRRPMAVVFVALFSIFLVRELDYFFDFYVVDNLWQVLFGLILSAAIVYGLRNQERFVQGWRRSWPSAGLALIIGGLIMLIPYAQLIGHEPLWESMLSGEYRRVYKVIAEEFVELGGYLLIAIGSAEFLYAWSRLPRTRNLHERRRRR